MIADCLNDFEKIDFYLKYMDLIIGILEAIRSDAT
jgi:hypothetical protein